MQSHIRFLLYCPTEYVPHEGGGRIQTAKRRIFIGKPDTDNVQICVSYIINTI